MRQILAEDSGLAGVVITHGTNTLEETAWLLQLLIDDPAACGAGKRDAAMHGSQCRWGPESVSRPCRWPSAQRHADAVCW